MPKFRSEGPVRINQGMGEGRGGVLQGGLGTEKYEHNPRGKVSTVYSWTERSLV